MNRIMKTIRLVIFNEEYWGKGLIYSQNIMPLKVLSSEYNSKVELITFTSLPLMLLERKRIKETKEMLQSENVKVRNYPVLYFPTRFLLPRWFLLPYFYLNVMFYVLWLRLADGNKEVVYNLRSYQPALAFYLFYGHKERLVFDPRTDFVEEKVNAGHFKENGLTAMFWNKMEGDFVRKMRKTIVISDPFKENMVRKHHLQNDNKLAVVYNPINYSHFSREKEPHKGVNFLYTGSLGGWNKIENYLEVFKAYHEKNPNSKFIVCTSASPAKIEQTLLEPAFDDVKDSVEVHFNVSYDELPKYYAQCDYGFQIMKKRDSRVGVKFIEYIAAGVTPIVSKEVEGAVVLAERYGMGIVINSDDTQEEIVKKIENMKGIDRNAKGYQDFKMLTDTANIGERIKGIYFDGAL